MPNKSINNAAELSKNFCKNILEKFTVKKKQPNGTVMPPDDNLDRQQLLDAIFNHFKLRFKEETTKRSMLFPTSFMIKLQPEDFERRKQGFLQTAQDVVDEINEFCRYKLELYPNYRTHSPFMEFKYAPISVDDIIDGAEKEQENNERVIVISTIYPSKHTGSNLQHEDNPIATCTGNKKNNLELIYINKDAYMRMQNDAKYVYTYELDKEFKKQVKIENTDRINHIAIAFLTNRNEIFLDNDGRKDNKIAITENLITITNRNDSRQGIQFVKLNTDDIIVGHVQIRYLSVEEKFQIAAFAKTRLTGKLLDLSEGGTIKWYDLANKSQIFMNDTEAVEFKINL